MEVMESMKAQAPVSDSSSDARCCFDSVQEGKVLNKQKLQNVLEDWYGLDIQIDELIRQTQSDTGGEGLMSSKGFESFCTAPSRAGFE